MSKVCFNGAFYNDNEALFTAANRGFRYGDGLFETAKVLHGEVLVFNLHWERLTAGLQALQIDAAHLSAKKILAEIKQLCEINNCTNAARLRLAVYRNEDGKAAYVLEASPLHADAFQWDEKGWKLSIYPHVRESCDELSNHKTANYLPYIMAGRHAAANNLDECLILNTDEAICDGSKTNVFLVQRNEVFTPALHQGCVAGVMRRYILSASKKEGVAIHEGVITEADLQKADEIFLTNAIQGMRWVSHLGERNYGSDFSKSLFEKIIKPMYS